MIARDPLGGGLRLQFWFLTVAINDPDGNLSSGLDLMGLTEGWVTLIDFRNSEVGHLSNCPKMTFQAFLGYFG